MSTIRDPLRRLGGVAGMVLLIGAFWSWNPAPTADAAQRKSGKKGQKGDPYAHLVWPPPPSKARIKLEEVIRGRIDLEGQSRLSRRIIGRSRDRFDWLIKPIGVDFDSRGRVLVTDSANAAVFRFDLSEGRVDVFGTRTSVRLKLPLGLGVGPDDVVYVADGGLRQVLAFDGEGRLLRAYGKGGELVNPTDALVSPDGKRLYVADSRAHQVKIFDLETRELLSSFGSPGSGNGQFNHPTSLAVDPEGQLYVVDQINARVQVFAQDGEYLDQFGESGRDFGSFTRPKDIAIDEVGFIYVTDTAFNNFQIFDVDFTLLTYVGTGGKGAGQFSGASGIAVRGDEIAVVDQIGSRAQLFRFIVPKDE